jgi:hypothetical protein
LTKSGSSYQETARGKQNDSTPRGEDSYLIEGKKDRFGRYTASHKGYYVNYFYLAREALIKAAGGIF